jgi:hypothetical protein
VLRRIFGTKKEEVIGEWRRLHNEEHYALYSSNIIRVTKSRRMRLEGHVARMGDRRGAYRWEDYIKMGLHEVERGAWTGFIWLRIGTGGGQCECGNEPSGSIKCGEFLD